MQRVLTRLRSRRLLAASTGSLESLKNAPEAVAASAPAKWWQREPEKDGLVRLDSGEVCSVYLGFDPTADGLHVGHLVGLMALRAFQKEGFRPIALLGGATGMIGDPSGRSTERPMLDREAAHANAMGLLLDIERLLDFKAGEPNSAILVNNLDWYAPMSVFDFFAEVGHNFRVSAMMSRESVKARLGDGTDSAHEGLSFTEFAYQIFQGYDFWHLYQSKGCCVQLGGSDQWGNIASGLDLIRRMTPKDTVSDAIGVTVPLLTNRAGEKFGKSAGNAVWLNPDKTSDFEFYQFFLRVEDEMVEELLYKLTELPVEDISGIVEAHNAAPEKRDAQRRLAQSVTEMVRGKASVHRAEVATQALFGGDLDALTADDLLGIDMPRVTLQGDQVQGRSVVDLFVAAKAVKSKGEARRLASSGGLYVQNKRITDANLIIDLAEHATEGRVILIRSGKQKYTVVSIEA